MQVVTVFDEKDAIREMPDADFYFGWSMPLPLLEVAKKLKWIHTPSAGRDYIDSPMLREKGIEFTNSEGYHGIFMAQHAMGMMLYFAKAMHFSKKQFWPRNEVAGQFFDLNLTKILIVGCGSIGLKLAELCHAFEMHVSGYRRNIPIETSNKMLWVGPNSLKQAIQESKIIVNLLPGTDETFHFFNQERFSYFSKGSVFINLGRGRTVDEKALLDLLNKDVLLGCGLDVLELEPPVETHPLYAKENVLITPHSSAFSYQYLDHAIAYFCNELTKRIKVF
jgi:phosphoglycerate dehydrogenase-like enzyme